MNAIEAFQIFDEKCDFYQYLVICREKGLPGCVTYIQQVTGCDVSVAEQIINQHDFLHPSKYQLSPQEIARNNAEALALLNKPKCPICGSTNLSKITTTKKVAKIAMFGIFGMGDNGKTWKCNNCGSKF